MDNIPIVGRTRELKTFQDLLDRHEPALVAVSARAGMGKTRFLLELEALAGAKGWAVAYRRKYEEFAIHPDSTAESFSKSLRRYLDLLAPEESTLFGKNAGQLRRSPTLLQQMNRRAPVLVQVDGYQPEPRFSAWFEHSFVTSLREGSMPALLVIADVPEIMEPLAARMGPDAMIELGPLAIDEVTEFFRSTTQGVEPPLGVDELERYSQAASEDPEVLVGLARVLPLAAEVGVESNNRSLG